MAQFPPTNTDPAGTPDVRPGWQTSEFWLAAVKPLLATLVAFGVIGASDATTLGGALATGVTAIFALLTSAHVVTTYIQGRIDHKSEALKASKGLLVLLGLLALCGAAPAQSTFTPQREAGLQIGFLNLGNGCCRPRGQQQQQQAPQTDPAVLELLRTISSQNQQLLSLMAQQQRSAPTVPAQPQTHQIYLLPYQQPAPGVQQALPISGQPQQSLPIAGAPQQALPIQGAPQQVLPAPGTPQQQLSPQGGPQQQLPIIGQLYQVVPIPTPGGAPAQPQFAQPSPAPPTPVAPAPQQPQQPQQSLPLGRPSPSALPAAPPSGYQRYTSHPFVRT